MSSESLDIQTPSGTFETQIDVRWGEMDALRHVNNTVYFRYFEDARVRLFFAMGLDGAANRYGVLAHASCDFLKPLMYPARVTVGMKCVRIGRTSLELDCWIADAGDPETLHARGQVKVGDTLISRSIIGSEFEVGLSAETTVAGKPAIIPTIAGRGFTFGLHQVALDPADPMAEGFALTDVWGPSAGDIPEPRK